MLEQFFLRNYHKGWIVGNFSPRLFSSIDIEVGVKRFNAGETEPCHYQKLVTEFTLVLDGSIVLGGFELSAGDILRIDPMEHARFLSLTESELLVIKTPSLPSDKTLCQNCNI